MQKDKKKKSSLFLILKKKLDLKPNLPAITMGFFKNESEDAEVGYQEAKKKITINVVCNTIKPLPW